jgi:hypothetical protein
MATDRFARFLPPLGFFGFFLPQLWLIVVGFGHSQSSRREPDR